MASHGWNGDVVLSKVSGKGREEIRRKEIALQYCLTGMTCLSILAEAIQNGVVDSQNLVIERELCRCFMTRFFREYVAYLFIDNRSTKKDTNTWRERKKT